MGRWPIGEAGAEDGAVSLPYLPARCAASYSDPQVQQSYVIVEMEQQCAAIYSVLRRHAQDTPGACACVHPQQPAGISCVGWQCLESGLLMLIALPAPAPPQATR